MWPFTKAETRGNIENPNVPLTTQNLHLHYLGGVSAAGIAVNAHTALECTPVYAAVKVLADTMASLPLQIFDTSGDDAIPATDLPLYTLLHDRPNEGLHSFKWRRMIMRNLLLPGRHYTRIERNRAGRITGLFPLRPADVSVERRRGGLVYIVNIDGGGKEVLPANEVLHFTAMEDEDGIDGLSPVHQCRNAIGLYMAMETYPSTFFSNGARPGLVMEYPSRLSPEGIDQLKASIEATHGGVGNSNKVMVMEDGGKLHNVSMSPEQSQLTEGRRFQLEEIARAFNVPLSFLQNLDNAHFANAEQQDLSFVKHTISPWVRMMEQEMSLKLLSKEMMRTREIRFNLDGLLRGDFATRMSGYATGIQNAVLTPNEARKLERRPAKDGGDELMIQQNMADLGKLGEEPPAPAPVVEQEEPETDEE